MNLSVSEANGCTTNDVPIMINRSHSEKSYNDKKNISVSQLSRTGRHCITLH